MCIVLYIMKSNWTWLSIRFNLIAETPWYAQISLDASLNTSLKFYWTCLLDWGLMSKKKIIITNIQKVPATYSNIHIILIPKNAHNHWNSCCNKSSSANGIKKKDEHIKLGTNIHLKELKETHDLQQHISLQIVWQSLQIVWFWNVLIMNSQTCEILIAMYVSISTIC